MATVFQGGYVGGPTSRPIDLSPIQQGLQQRNQRLDAIPMAEFERYGPVGLAHKAAVGDESAERFLNRYYGGDTWRRFIPKIEDKEVVNPETGETEMVRGFTPPPGSAWDPQQMQRYSMDYFGFEFPQGGAPAESQQRVVTSDGQVVAAKDKTKGTQPPEQPTPDDVPATTQVHEGASESGPPAERTSRPNNTPEGAGQFGAAPSGDRYPEYLEVFHGGGEGLGKSGSFRENPMSAEEGVRYMLRQQIESFANAGQRVDANTIGELVNGAIQMANTNPNFVGEIDPAAMAPDLMLYASQFNTAPPPTGDEQAPTSREAQAAQQMQAAEATRRAGAANEFSPGTTVPPVVNPSAPPEVAPSSNPAAQPWMDMNQSVDPNAVPIGPQSSLSPGAWDHNIGAPVGGRTAQAGGDVRTDAVTTTITGGGDTPVQREYMDASRAWQRTLQAPNAFTDDEKAAARDRFNVAGRALAAESGTTDAVEQPPVAIERGGNPQTGAIQEVLRVGDEAIPITNERQHTTAQRVQDMVTAPAGSPRQRGATAALTQTVRQESQVLRETISNTPSMRPAGAFARQVDQYVRANPAEASMYFGNLANAVLEGRKSEATAAQLMGQARESDVRARQGERELAAIERRGPEYEDAMVNARIAQLNAETKILEAQADIAPRMNEAELSSLLAKTDLTKEQRRILEPYLQLEFLKLDLQERIANAQYAGGEEGGLKVLLDLFKTDYVQGNDEFSESLFDMLLQSMGAGYLEPLDRNLIDKILGRPTSEVRPFGSAHEPLTPEEEAAATDFSSQYDVR